MVKKQRSQSTISLFVSGTVISLTQSLEQATLVAGQIGRAAAVYRIHEVVIVDEESDPQLTNQISQGAALLAKLLQYQETPQYLRKHLIPIHDDLRCVGSLPPLDAPHHQRSSEWSRFREGVVLSHEQETHSKIDIGLEQMALVPQKLPLGIRVTLNVGHRPKMLNKSDVSCYQAKVCTPLTPWLEYGVYWGFTVRIAKGLSSVFLQCPFQDGYDLVIGTSERGTHLSPVTFQMPSFSHALIGFGGPSGLEDCCSRDPHLKNISITRLCHYYLNTCPHQGSRTIRTEEAIWLSLSFLQIVMTHTDDVNGVH